MITTVSEIPFLHTRLLFCITLGVILLSGSSAYGGRGYYTSPEGNDNGSGTLDDPYKTISHAIGLATPGDTVYILEGTYYEQYLEPNSGTPEEWLVIRSAHGEKAVIDGGGLEAEHYSGFRLENKDYIVIEGLIIRNFFDIGIDIRYAGHITIRNCELASNGSAGVALNYARDSSQVIVEDCIAHHNGWGVSGGPVEYISTIKTRANTLTTLSAATYAIIITMARTTTLMVTG